MRQRTFRSITVAFACLMTACNHSGQTNMLVFPDEVLPESRGFEIKDGQWIYKTNVSGKTIYSYPGVADLTLFSLYLLKHTEIKKGESVLDVGTGSGVQAIFAAENASHVLATDIDKNALKSVLKNAREHNVTDKISVRISDLFKSIKPNEKFDVIISSIPMPWNNTNHQNWALYERFFANVGNHLNPDGRIYFVSIYLNNLQRTRKLTKDNNLKIIRLDMGYTRKQNFEPIVYVIQHAKMANNSGNKNKKTITSSNDSY